MTSLSLISQSWEVPSGRPALLTKSPILLILSFFSHSITERALGLVRKIAANRCSNGWRSVLLLQVSCISGTAGHGASPSQIFTLWLLWPSFASRSIWAHFMRQILLGSRTTAAAISRRSRRACRPSSLADELGIMSRDAMYSCKNQTSRGMASASIVSSSMRKTPPASVWKCMRSPTLPMKSSL